MVEVGKKAQNVIAEVLGPEADPLSAQCG